MNVRCSCNNGSSGFNARITPFAVGGEMNLLISASEQRRREFIWKITNEQQPSQHDATVAAMINTAMPYFNVKTQNEIIWQGCFGFG